MSVPDVFIGFSTTDVWLSKLIRSVSRSKYSHAWVRHGSELWGGQWVTQADWPVVRTWPWDMASRTWTVQQLYRPTFDITLAMRSVRKDFEKRYDIAGLFGIFLVTVVQRWFHRRIQNPLASPDELFCSEFVCQMLMNVRLPDGTALPETERWSPEQASPKLLEKYCRRHPELFERIQGVPTDDTGKTRNVPAVGPQPAEQRKEAIAKRKEAKAFIAKGPR